MRRVLIVAGLVLACATGASAQERPPTVADLQEEIKTLNQVVAVLRNQLREMRIQAVLAASASRQLSEQVVDAQLQTEIRQAQAQIAAREKADKARARPPADKPVEAPKPPQE